MHLAVSEQKHPMYAHKSIGENSHAFLARELPLRNTARLGLRSRVTGQGGAVIPEEPRRAA